MKEKEDRYKGLSWLSEEGRANLIYLDELVEKQNITGIFNLEDNSEFSTTLHQILVRKYDSNEDSLNEAQLNLFLCMHLENSGQSCSILSCLQEWFPQHLNKFVPALEAINATNSANAINKAISLLPKDGSWFFKTSNEETENLLSKYDSLFSDYPDGSMPDLYRRYAEQNRAKIEERIKNNSK